MSKLATMSTLSAFLLCGLTATAASALILFSETFYAFESGQGGTATFVSLPPNAREFGIGRTNSALLAHAEANSNSSAGYVADLVLGRGRKPSSVREVIVYFNKRDSAQGARLRDLNFHVHYRYTTRINGTLQQRNVNADARFNDLGAIPVIPGTGGWRAARINLGVDEPVEAAELHLVVLLRNRSDQDESVEFGKIEITPEPERIQSNLVILEPKSRI